MRADLQESGGGYFLRRGKGLPRLCHYNKVVNSAIEPAGPSRVTKMAWVTKWSGTQTQLWRRAGVKFPSGLSPWLSALGADNLHQGVTLLGNERVNSNHLVGLVIRRE